MKLKFSARESLVILLIVAACMALIARAFYLQVQNQDFHQKEAEKRHVRAFDIAAERGVIYDRNGSILALSTPMASITVDPEELIEYETNYRKFLTALGLSDSEFNNRLRANRHKRLSFIGYADQELMQTIKSLDLDGVKIRTDRVSFKRDGKQIDVTDQKPAVWVEERLLNRYRYNISIVADTLGLSEATLRSKVYKSPNSRFMYVQRLTKVELAEKLKKKHLYGVFIKPEYRRYYPAGEITGNLIGFTNVDNIGIEGLERTYETYLAGKAGSKKIVKSRDGQVIDFIEEINPVVNGNSVTLSIDQNIQYFTYKALKKVFIQHQAESASAVVLDAKTGEILAMASLPGFNPNDISQRIGAGTRNRTVSDLLEPGSTIKPFTIAKALDDEIITEDSIIKTGNGSFHIKNSRITDTSAHGDLTPLQIIQKSSNIGTAKIAMQFEGAEQFEYWHQLGFDKESGNYLPGERAGNLRSAELWDDPIIRATASYGYGFNTNLLSLARAYTVFANEGKVLPVSIIKTDQPPEGVQVLSESAALKTLEMMETVVERGGTAPKAKIPGYRIAGKTGTVHKVSNKGGYQENTYMSVFAGMVPASNPDMVMVIAVNEPSRGVYYGGAVAAPVFKTVMQNALRLRSIPPDGVEEK